MPCNAGNNQAQMSPMLGTRLVRAALNAALADAHARAPRLLRTKATARIDACLPMLAKSVAKCIRCGDAPIPIALLVNTL